MTKFDRPPRVSDTSPESARVNSRSLRSLDLEGRAHLTFAASDSLRSIVTSGIRHRHPDYDDEAVRLAFLRLWLGPELFQVIHPGVEVTP
ncbi:MAG: hypothetical protein GY715_16870 [Planctomycetes bacterium]|nr:hypothetical protein [Planctomycetota bacterium]